MDVNTYITDTDMHAVTLSHYQCVSLTARQIWCSSAIWCCLLSEAEQFTIFKQPASHIWHSFVCIGAQNCRKNESFHRLSIVKQNKRVVKTKKKVFLSVGHRVISHWQLSAMSSAFNLGGKLLCLWISFAYLLLCKIAPSLNSTSAVQESLVA